MTGFLMISALLISAIFTVDVSHTIFEIRRQRAAMKRKTNGFNV